MMLKKELTLNSESALQRVYSYSLSCTFYEQDPQWLHFWSCSGVSTSSANIMGCEFNSVMTSHTSTMGGHLCKHWIVFLSHSGLECRKMGEHD